MKQIITVLFVSHKYYIEKHFFVFKITLLNNFKPICFNFFLHLIYYK